MNLLEDNLIEIKLLRNFLGNHFVEDFLAENNELWKKFRLEWNYNSNHIEGNTLTYGETELLLFFDKTTGDHEKREYDEMQAHDVAIHLIKDWALNSERDVTEADIRELNRTILVKPFWKEAITPDGQPTRRLIDIGEYKKHPNSVRLKNGEMFHYSSPQETPQLMNDLIGWYRENETQHPLILASDLHYKFIRIHPFDDGNGRIARLLVNFVLMKNGYPPIIIKSKDKDKYITALNKADTGNIEAFHEYMSEQLLWSLKLSAKAFKGENIEEDDDLEKEIEILNRELKSKKSKTEPKSLHSIIEVINNFLIPLFIKVENNINPLKEHFFKSERHIYYQPENTSSNFQLGNIHSDITDLQKKLQEKLLSDRRPLIRIEYELTLQGFKLSELGQSICLRVSCNFHDFNYTLKIHNDSEIKFPYGRFNSEKEISELIKPSIRKFLDDIRKFRETND